MGSRSPPADGARTLRPDAGRAMGDTGTRAVWADTAGVPRAAARCAGEAGRARDEQGWSKACSSSRRGTCLDGWCGAHLPGEAGRAREVQARIRRSYVQSVTAASVSRHLQARIRRSRAAPPRRGAGGGGSRTRRQARRSTAAPQRSEETAAPRTPCQARGPGVCGRLAPACWRYRSGCGAEGSGRLTRPTRVERNLRAREDGSGRRGRG